MGDNILCQQKRKTIVEGIIGLKRKGMKYYVSGITKC